MTYNLNGNHRRRPRLFGRLAWVEAEVGALKVGFLRHLDEHLDDRKNIAERFDKIDDKFDTMGGKLDGNTRNCIDKAEGVRIYLASLIWKALVGALGLIVGLAATLVHFRPTL